MRLGGRFKVELRPQIFIVIALATCCQRMAIGGVELSNHYQLVQNLFQCHNYCNQNNSCFLLQQQSKLVTVLLKLGTLYSTLSSMKDLIPIRSLRRRCISQRSWPGTGSQNSCRFAQNEIELFKRDIVTIFSSARGWEDVLNRGF